MRSLRAKGLLALALPTLSIVGILSVLLALGRGAQEREQRLETALAIEAAAAELLSLQVDAETGVRGYLVTGRTLFLGPADVAGGKIPGVLDRLDRLRQQQPGPEPAADLRVVVEQELAFLQELRAQGPEIAVDRTQFAELAADIKARTDVVRRQVTILRQHQDAVRRQAAARRSQERSRATRDAILVAAFGVIGGFGVSIVLVANTVRRVRHVEANARRLAAGERLVPGERLGSDELASMAVALEQAATLVQDQRQRLALALEVGRIVVWEVDSSGRMSSQGDRADQYGRTLESDLSTLRPEHAQLVRDGVTGVRHDGAPRDYEVQSVDGRWFSGRLMRSSETAVIAVSVDVTALRQAQEKLREVEGRRGRDDLAASERRGQYNALVIGSAGEGIAAIDARGLCTSANPAAARMLGYEVVELIGRDVHALVHHSYPDGSPYPPAECLMRRAATTGQAARVDSEVFWRRDGTRLPVAYAVSPLGQGGVMKGAVVTFTDISVRNDAEEEFERAAADLRQGIRDGAMVLHYQPKINLLTGECQAVEALVRWQREDRLVFPDDFISTAERGGVIDELTGWVVNAAAAQAAAWRAAGLELRVAVNLSALSLTDDHIIDVLCEAAASHRIPVELLEVEITESAAAENPAAVIAVLAKLAALKVRTAIDDFGTGFSSLSYLKHLPVSALKIDKSFVMNMTQDTRDQAIVASTVHMAHSLGMAVVAEGVETDVILRILRRATCDTGQGYHWSKPVPPEALEDWLRRHQSSSV